MNNQHIIFIPGKSPKPLPKEHRDQLWRTLLEGVRRAQPDSVNKLEAFKKTFHLAAWNHTYYQVTRDIDHDLPWIDALMNNHGATEQDIKQSNSTLFRITQAIYSIADHLPFLIRWLPNPVRQTIEETNRYFQNKKNIMPPPL